MNSYNKLIAVSVVAIFTILLSANLLFFFMQSDEANKPYMVEINRAYAEIVKANDPKSVTVDDYEHLNSITYLSTSHTPEEREAFFSGQPNSVVRVFNDSYLRFDYRLTVDQDNSSAWMLLNGGILVIGALCLGVLLYVKVRLIKPFTQIRDMPYELAKGHLTTGLKENKSRYFGRFIWGLDLLRQTLEARKQSELNLTKENKMMVLSLSHDIKTPLAAIRLYAKALYEELYDTDEKRHEIAHHVDEKAQEIEGYVRDLIKTSQEDFLHIEVTNSDFYLNDLIAKVNSYYAEKLSLIKCNFIIEEYQNLLLFGDIERYVEVIENIIENAIKYGNGKEIRISFPLEEDHQVIAISNTGETFPEGELVHLWESFWRGSNATTQEGSGLGLYICRFLMTEMQGDIYAATGKDTMTITLIPKEA